MNNRIKYILAVLLLSVVLVAVEVLVLAVDLYWYSHLINGVICAALVWLPPFRVLLNNVIKGN